jgi:hypothetical protein
MTHSRPKLFVLDTTDSLVNGTSSTVFRLMSDS